MSTSQCDSSQNNVTDTLLSRPVQPAQQSILPPFSGKLRKDEKLKLSKDSFKESIDNFFQNKDINPIDQLTTTPAFPTPYVLAQFASKAYEDYKRQETDADYEKRLILPDGWKLLTTASNTKMNNGYFGAAYWHPDYQQVVIAHRGTKLNSFGALWTDIKGVLFKHYVKQMDSATTFAHKVVDVLQEVNREKGVHFQVFFTGHSLGGWLAQVTTYTTEYLKREDNNFLKNDNAPQSYHPHTVVFDSPGCKAMLSEMIDTFHLRQNSGDRVLQNLDITSYLSAPNRINTCNTHVGTVYRVFIDTCDMGCWAKHTAVYNVATHSMNKILDVFDPKTGQVQKDEKDKLRIQEVIDWPVSGRLLRRREYKRFFKWAKQFNNYQPEITDEYPRAIGFHPIRYQTKVYEGQVNNLRIFNQEEKEFLQGFRILSKLPEFFRPKEVFSVMQNDKAEEEAEKKLQSFQIENDNVHCADASILQDLIPYVRRLLQLFPKIKDNVKYASSPHEVRNRVYQFETKTYLEDVKKSLLDFNPDILGLKEFLESDQQKVFHLRMVDGDAWTGLIKVCRTIEKMTGNGSFPREGQYTIMNLDRFLAVNKRMDFNRFMTSTETLYLLMISWENNHLCNDETKQVFPKLFNTVQEKPLIKIILTTQSRGTSVDFLQQIASTAPTNMFVSRDETLTWADLTTESQKKVLGKTVEFQGREIALNELIAVDSPVACYLPISGLLGEHPIKIAEEPISNSTSYGYNEKWYIERTFNHKVAIKQDILHGMLKENFPDILANTEQEFKLLCQQNPERNVHLLVKDNSGKLVWQASQGSLEKLRKYIDTQTSHAYTPMGLDKLLEQAQHQRLMVISDTAGMGKSTVLTHLSKQIKQKFPNSWVIRIDLNHHTDELKTLKKGTIDKEKATEFLSKELLKLKTEFDFKLFEHCSEERQKIRIVLMLDGFDEISPKYDKTVIDLLQTLKIMSGLEFWITTRPHLRQTLEDNLQQLSYTLEPFSKENQVEFLKKFWRLRDWFPEVGNGQKGKDKKLETYARKLIMKLATSISDRDKEFTGIPLQCRMLAEAFDEKVKTFYLSSDSMPDLPYKLDLLELYEQFINSKYDIYIGDKFRIPLTNVILDNLREKLVKEAEDFHQGLAIQMLFPRKIATLQINGISAFSDKNVTEMSRIGIVQVNYEDKPHFIHRTFAEYNVANVVVNQMTKEPSPSPQIQDFVLKDVLLKEEYLVIRVFIDGLLSKFEPTIIFKQYGNRIDELSKDGVMIQQRRTTILHQAVQEGNTHIIGYLFDILKEGKHAETLNGLLLAKNNDGRTAWHLAIKGDNKELWRNLWKWAEETLTPQEINKKLLLAKDNFDATVWHWAAKEGNIQLLETIWGWAKKNLAGDELSNGLLLADIFGKTAWHFAADMGNTQVVEKLWEWGKEILTSEELNCKLLLAKDELEKTVWHQVAMVDNIQLLDKVWGWAKETLTLEQLNNELLLAKDLWGKTAFNVALDFGNKQITTKLWECAREILATNEINKLLLDKDTKGITAWHSAAEVGNMEMLEKLWNYANEGKLNLKNDLLLAEDRDGHTAWLLATKSGRGAISEKIWMWAEKELTVEELKNNFFFAKGFNQPTAWHLAAANGGTYQLKYLWAWAKENLTPEELKYELLLAKEFCGNTAWLQAIQSCNIMVMRKLWIWCAQELTREEFNNMLLGKNSWGQTALHLAAKGSEAGTIQLVWEVAKKLELNFRDNFLLAEDNDGHTPWLLGANEGNVEVLEKLWVMAKEELTTEELKNKLLLAKNRKQQTAMHLAAEKGNPYALEKLWVWASDELTPEDIYHKLMLAKDLRGQTAWHRAAELGHTTVLEKVNEWLVPLTSKLNCEVPDFVTDILLAKQRDFYAWVAQKLLSYEASNTK